MRRLGELILLIIFLILLSCDFMNTKKSKFEKYQGSTYVDTIFNIYDNTEIRIMLTLGVNIGGLLVEEDSLLLPKRIEQYYFHQENNALILSTSFEDCLDTCFITEISDDSLVLIHKNTDLFFSNQKTTVLYR